MLSDTDSGDYMYHIAKKFKRASAFYVIMKCTNLCTYTTNVCDHFQSEHFFALTIYFLIFLQH